MNFSKSLSIHIDVHNTGLTTNVTTNTDKTVQESVNRYQISCLRTRSTCRMQAVYTKWQFLRYTASKKMGVNQRAYTTGCLSQHYI